MASATTAALATCVACYPRLVQWQVRPHALWFLVAVLLVSTWVLWGFVFAWHTRYTSRPVIAKRFELSPFISALVLGLGLGAVLHFGFDSAIKSRMPEEFPESLGQWVSMTLFVLAFQQLFLLFAPVALFSRLLGGRIAVILTVFFGGLIILIKAEPLINSTPWYLGSGFLLVRMLAGLFSIYFYLRGGIVLAYWWVLVVQSREILDLF